MSELDPREEVMACHGHALVLGGPGSGKTTLALKKSMSRLQQGLLPGQSILFLSFSRAAVTRVFDAAKHIVPNVDISHISIQTFHSFFWEVLKTHAYLLGAPRKLSILLPQDEKALSGGINEEDESWDLWSVERERLFWEEGRISFDLFAANVAELLNSSSYLRSGIALKHPLIIVDEAQDTGEKAWRCIEILAPYAQLICLADLEQQIFDFLPGVGPERITVIRETLKPLEVDLGSDNHRSPNTEILSFGNDILSGKPRGGPYTGVTSLSYGVGKSAPNWNHLLRRALSQLHRSVREEGNGSARSVAILTIAKGGALRVSNALNGVGANQGKAVRHKLLFDEAEALLTARLVAFLLEPKFVERVESDVATAIELLAASRKATGTSKAATDKMFEQAAKIRKGKVLNVNLANAFRAVISSILTDGFSGDPATDWLKVKSLLRHTGQPDLLRAVNQLDYIVAFQRGERLSANLASEWLNDGAYTNARLSLDIAFAQEQILDGIADQHPLQVMNIHKAKGKQFDGVILLRELRHSESGPESSFVWRGDTMPHLKSRRLLRVGITRAKRRLLILTPVWPQCPIIGNYRL